MLEAVLADLRAEVVGIEERVAPVTPASAPAAADVERLDALEARLERLVGEAVPSEGIANERLGALEGRLDQLETVLAEALVLLAERFERSTSPRRAGHGGAEGGDAGDVATASRHAS
jgi:hypothetical protein